jgi:hypothetical protein
MFESLRNLLFPEVWGSNGRVYSSKPYDELSPYWQAKHREILGVKRYTLSVSPFEYKSSKGFYTSTLTFSVPGDFRSFPPFKNDDENYPGLAAELHKAYED